MLSSDELHKHMSKYINCVGGSELSIRTTNGWEPLLRFGQPITIEQMQRRADMIWDTICLAASEEIGCIECIEVHRKDTPESSLEQLE